MSRIARFLPLGLSTLRSGVNYARRWARLAHPKHRAADRLVRSRRAQTEERLRALGEASAARFDGDVLIDGQWDNPNYWFRTGLLRAALGLAHAREIGLLGEHRTAECARSLSNLGIDDQRRLADIPVDRGAVRRCVDALISETKTAADILLWRLPGDLPAAIVYDALLKRQRVATVDIHRRDFREILTLAIENIHRVQSLLDERDFKLVVVSHPYGLDYGVIAHQALARGVPVIMPFGFFGVLRMTLLREPADLTTFYDRPTGAEIDALSPQKADALAKIGRQSLDSRLQGKADDLASVYAYRRAATRIDRPTLCRRFGWDPEKPIVGFYASNWFDWPHQLGMTQFRDFLDWTEATFAAAVEATEFNWLFKPHPCEDWFGGIRLRDILANHERPAHIAIADQSWNNGDVLPTLDALVTYHGTAGIEFAAYGRPVLAPDRGKYDDCGFVKVARDRDDYLALLKQAWWRDMDLTTVKRRAEIFAGWWFCAPEWQRDFLLPDDGQQDALYAVQLPFLDEKQSLIADEIAMLAAWWNNGHRYYHTYKMHEAESYKLTSQ